MNDRSGAHHLVLICREPRLAHEVVRKYSTDVLIIHVFESLREFQRFGRDVRPWAGALIHQDVAILASTSEKSCLREMRTAGVPTLEFVDQVDDAAWAIFREAVDQKGFRDSRKTPRFRKIVRVVLTLEGGAAIERSVTADLSEGGCFLVRTEDLPVGTLVRFRIEDGSREHSGEVVWSRTWGRIRNEWPGVGIRFESTPELQEEIRHHLGGEEV